MLGGTGQGTSKHVRRCIVGAGVVPEFTPTGNSEAVATGDQPADGAVTLAIGEWEYVRLQRGRYVVASSCTDGSSHAVTCGQSRTCPSERAWCRHLSACTIGGVRLC